MHLPSRSLPLLLLLTAGLLLSACDEQSPVNRAVTPEATAESSPAKTETMPSGSEPVASPAPQQETSADDPDVLVVVNGVPVTKDVYAIFHQQRRQAFPGANQSPEQQLAILNELVNYMLISQDAEARGLDKSPQVAATLNLVRARVLTEMAVNDYVQRNEIPEQELRALYAERYGDQKVKEFKARHILLENEEDAKVVIAELDKGADFAALAKERSTGPSAAQGGDLGWFGSTQMVKPFAAAVAMMEDGSHSSVPVKTQFGWHVILREESRESDPPSFEEVQDQLLQRKRQELLKTYISGLRDKADIQIKAKTSSPPAAQ